MSEAPNVKKVSPYPISLNIFEKVGAAPIPGSIVKLTDRGFLAKVTLPGFKVHEHYSVHFTIPVLNFDINSEVMVMKTYDSFEKYKPGEAKVYLIEMHFVKMDGYAKSKIVDFLIKIGQTEER